MPDYDFKIDHGKIKKGTSVKVDAQSFHALQHEDGALTRDAIIYAVLARFALNSDENIEFQTVFDEETQTVELIFPEEHCDLFDQVTGMQRGPNFKKYIDWLIGSQTLTAGGAGALRDVNFMGVGEISSWTGATKSFVNDQLVLTLPTDCFASIGQNFKSESDSLDISFIWMFMDGANDDFTVKLSVYDGTSDTVTTTETTISTFNLVNGDIRESLLGTFSVTNGGLVNIVLSRNYDGSPDPQTELISVLGFRIE